MTSVCLVTNLSTQMTQLLCVFKKAPLREKREGFHCVHNRRENGSIHAFSVVAKGDPAKGVLGM